MPSINNFLQGFQDGLPGMKDYRHASRLYIDNNYKLMPKQKFMYHVVFDTDETLFFNGFNQSEKFELNMLVKACDLPKYDMSVEEKTQYNKKMYLATRIAYDPVNITFHDDHADTVNAFWKKYYEYHIADSVAMTSDQTVQNTLHDYYDGIGQKNYTKFGMDTPKKKKKPYLRSVQIFVLHKQRFTSMTLVNPVIGSFSHDNLDAADGTGILSNTMQILYETVIYQSGNIRVGAIPSGFAQIHYDKEPSPLTVLGGGTNSIFGPGGVVDGVGSVIRNVQSGNILGAILAASNTYNNAKKIKKQDAKEELKGIVKKGVLEVGKQAGTVTNPVGSFNVGTAVAVGTVLASAKGMDDKRQKQDATVIGSPQLDTTNFLGPDEAFNLINTTEAIKDEVAAAIYFKDFGSRNGLSPDASNIQYNNANATTKRVYRNKAITDVRKLVNNGSLKIDRNTQNVLFEIEKASL